MMKIKDEKKYVIQNGFVGNCMYFWALNDSGYTCHLENVETYTLEKAQSRCRPDQGEKVWPASVIEKGATMQVDMQKIDWAIHEEFTPEQPPVKKPKKLPWRCGCGKFIKTFTESCFDCD